MHSLALGFKARERCSLAYTLLYFISKMIEVAQQKTNRIENSCLMTLNTDDIQCAN